METPRPTDAKALAGQLHELREAFESRLHRDTARVQLAFQRRCDQLYDESLADLSCTHEPEEARRLALAAVRQFRIDCKPKVEMVKEIIKDRKHLVDELMGILRDSGEAASLLQPHG